MKLDQRIEKIKEVLINKNAEEVSDFNTQNSDYFVDSVVIATARGDRHANALLQHLKEFLKNEELLRVENSDDWIVVDFGDVLVHIMNEKSRKEYNLEKFLQAYQQTTI